MPWKELLSAPAVNVALFLCVVLAVILYRVLTAKKKTNGNGHASVDTSWKNRMDQHASRSHEFAGRIQITEAEVRRLRVDVDGMKLRLEPLVIDVALVKALATGNKEDMDELKGEIKSIREHLSDKLDVLLSRLSKG